MKVLDCSDESIEEACSVLDEGGLVVYTTETTYALGVDALNEQALSDLLTAKRRPPGIPILVIISDLDMIRPYALIDERIQFLVETFMPGPLTLAVGKKPTVPDLLNPEGISFRISSHGVACALAKALGRPITGTSANRHGEGLIYDPEGVIASFDGVVDLFLDAGTLTESPPSTVIDMKPDIPVIIREGALPSEIILKALASFRQSSSTGKGVIS